MKQERRLNRVLRGHLSTLPTYAVLTLLALFALAPLLILLLNSVKSSAEVGMNLMGLPKTIHWENFSRAWRLGNYSRTALNSAVNSLATAIGVMVVAGLAAYSLARLRPVGEEAFGAYLLACNAIPAMLYIVPLFFLWVRLGLVNSRAGLIVIYCAVWSPFATLLLRSYMLGIPTEFDDAARIDGASEWQVLWHVILPMCRPGFMTIGLVNSLWAWNEFLFAVTFLHIPEAKVVTTSLYSFMTNRYGERDWGLTYAAGLMMVVPPMILFFLFKRRFIEGLAQGGLKG